MTEKNKLICPLVRIDKNENVASASTATAVKGTHVNETTNQGRIPEYSLYPTESKCFYNPYQVSVPIPVPATVTERAALAEIEAMREARRTAESQRRNALNLDKKARELSMTYEARENADAERALTEVKISLKDDKIKMSIIGTNGFVRRSRLLIEESFVSARKFIADYPVRTEIMFVTFKNKGNFVNLLYDAMAVKEGRQELLSVVTGVGLHMTTSRRHRGEIEEGLFRLLEDEAEQIHIPYDLGYFQDNQGGWHLAKPGTVTIRKLLQKVGDCRE